MITMETAADTATDLLRSRGLRSTAQRRAVLSALGEAPHATAPDLESLLGPGTAHGLSRQGLYNVLDDLARSGLVRCIEPAGSPARYELRVGDNHHHLVCRTCGRVQDVDCAVGAAPCLTPPETHGFALAEAEVTWWGTCGSCQEADA
ncbi:Fur family transcriptional regulator [Streptomyces sulphureus]|uniref:Fur family transcriptional regulator n=1 Tax=Streptomyces sulphureus TaxID=47758 RepID=UPI000380FA9F|nr:Fur family transcriptional regulator [Streptomyces sulphureus]